MSISLELLNNKINNFNVDYFSFLEKIKKLSETSPYIETESSSNIIINGNEIDISCLFDDILEKNKSLYFANLFYVEISPKISKKDFPSLYKLKKEIEDLVNNNYGYIKLSSKISKRKEEDVGFNILNNEKDLEDFLSKWNDCKKYLNDIYEEIKKYSENEIFLIVSDTGIKKGFSNGERTQEILLKTSKRLYKIDIESESHERQSFGKLYAENNNGWHLLKEVNPKRDFNIDISSKDSFNPDSFNPIINNFKEVIRKIEK